MNSLSPILNPNSVAIVGASSDRRKRGYRAVQTLLESEFPGQVYPVNPKGGEILGLHVHSSVKNLPSVPDLAFITTPAETVPGLLEECADFGVRGAVVPAVGFRESDELGARLEESVRTIAHERGIRLVGPNTSGVLNTSAKFDLVGTRSVKPGRIAVLSQSGNVALQLMQEASEHGCGISVYVGVGNETDIAFHEYLEYLEDDPATAAILMYVEGFRDGRKFIEVANRISHIKPIVLLKGGRSDRGVLAARSHTGAIAGSYPVLRAALRQGGVSEVGRSDELLPVGLALADQPPVPIGKGLVVLSDGGGHGTLAVDTLSAGGVTIAMLDQTTKSKLRDLLGRAANVENPIDVAGAADRDPSIFPKVFEILSRDESVGGVFVVGLFGGYAIRFSDALEEIEIQAAKDLGDLASESRLPVVVHSLYEGTDSAPLAELRRRKIPVVGSLEVGCRCFRALHARDLHLKNKPVPIPQPLPRRAEPECILAARREGRTVLMETEARRLLEETGAHVAPGVLCRTADDVIAAVAQMDSPVALKAVSPAISHKTEAGAVALNIEGVEAARDAFVAILAAAAQYTVKAATAPDIRGVLVMPMLKTPVAEMMVGVKRDPDFGPILTVGAGGIHVEIMHDTAIRGLPVGRPEALEMLNEIRIGSLLNGYRGRPAANREALADIILAIAACALIHPEIEEIEANPVFAYEDRALIVDARAFLNDLSRGHKQ